MRHWTEIDGWFELDEGMTLSMLSVGKDCLEIGSYKGRSTLAMAFAAKSVLSVDTFRADKGGQRQKDCFTTLDEFLKNIKGYGNVDYLIGRSEDVLLPISETFDLVFIDGLHTYKSVSNEIKLCWDKIRDDGIFAFHDYTFHEEIRRAIAEIFDVSKLEKVLSLAWIHKREGTKKW